MCSEVAFPPAAEAGHPREGVMERELTSSVDSTYVELVVLAAQGRLSDNVEIQVLGSALVAVTAPGLLQEPMAYLAADQLPGRVT